MATSLCEGLYPVRLKCFDEIKSQEVVLLGWFKCFNRELQDIGHFKQYLNRKFRKMGQDLKFNVYVRQIHIGKGNKTITHTLRFMVELEKRYLSSFLIVAIKFDRGYGRTGFHPFVN